MNQTKDLQKLFSNKINTLLHLKDKLSASYILDLYVFSVFEYNENPDLVFSKISTMFEGEIIIRSSASTEDQHSTNAGHFSSVQHVNSQNRNSVFCGINSVVKSYLRDNLGDSEFIFVQKQLTGIAFSGVALSYEPNIGKPYYLINYDDSGSTDSVTSGRCNQYMFIARDYNQADCIESKLCYALLEVERLCNESELNVEFAVSNDGDITIFQVRRLKTLFLPRFQKETLDNKNLYAANYLLTKDFLSDMAFWNPSEMIGEAPHPLDFSLYDYLITKSAWNEGIADIGYSVIKKNLMTKIGNKPYINLKNAFYALIPSDISDALRYKLVNYYCDILMRNKNLHDKIEFELVFTCFDFSTAKKLRNLEAHGFERDELNSLSSTLFQMTRALIENYQFILDEDLQKLNFLECSLEHCKEKYPINSKESILNSIKELMPIIRDNGVIPFARQARCAFIAHSLCISLIEEGLINTEVIDSIMHSVDSVTRNLLQDANLWRNKIISTSDFLSKYGHLRSHTYDITSPTYNELEIDKIFSEYNSLHIGDVDTYNDIKIKFPQSEFEISEFIKTAIAQRENFKFIFTKALSYILDSIVQLSKQLGISRNDISYLSLDEIYNFFSDNRNNLELQKTICKNKHDYIVNSLLALPSVIAEEKDFEVIKVMKSSPNFITNKFVEGTIVCLGSSSEQHYDVNGKIVAIQNADPGFDWIFAKGTIAGLITKYGGMASHMAIRCMEFDIPAAIGCGEFIYNRIIQGEKAILDCMKKEVYAR